MLSLWNDAVSGVCVYRLTESEEVEGLVRLFEGIAAAEGWQPEGALRRWTDRSAYFAAFVQARIAGGLQLASADASGRLPCQSIWPEVPIGMPSRAAHAAMLAIEPAFRGRSELFWSLGVEMWRFCVMEGISTLFLEVTPRVLPLYKRIGWPLEIRGERKLHWGEDCFLCSLGVAEVAEALLRRAEKSAYYRRIIAQAFRMTCVSGHPIESEEPLPTGAAC
jgi:hypothetical protein